MARLDAHRGAEVLETEAAGKVKSTFDDIKSTIRMPGVSLQFRLLAGYPEYLEVAWRQLHPNLQTVYVEKCADEIRSRAVERLADVGAPPRPGNDAEPVLRALHYAGPKLLIAIAALHAATGGQYPVLQTLPSEEKRQIRTGVPTDMPPIEEVNPDGASEDVKAIFDDVKRTLSASMVPTEFRALAHWPDYLGWAWQSVKTIIDRPEYRRTLLELRRLADETILALPFRVELSPHTLRLCGLSEADIDGIRDVLAMSYRLQLVTVAAIAFLSVGAAGQYGAAHSPFPPDFQ